MSGCFKAWAAYSRILVKLASPGTAGQAGYSPIHLHNKPIRPLGKVHIGWGQVISLPVSQEAGGLWEEHTLPEQVAAN